MSQLFDHEKLRVYREAIRFIVWAESALDGVSKSVAACGQLDRASTSVPLNIAEGNGKFTGPDRCRFFDTARASALECAAALDVLVAKNRLSRSTAAEGKAILAPIVAMLVGLIRTSSDHRLYEEKGDYGSPQTPPDIHP